MRRTELDSPMLGKQCEIKGLIGSFSSQVNLICVRFNDELKHRLYLELLDIEIWTWQGRD